jgi:hypothetical protein
MCGLAALRPLLIASTVISTAGAGLQALQANKQAKYQARIADRNASLENEAARQEIDNSRTAATAHWRNVAALKGRQRVAAAANGVSLDFGSAVDVAGDTDMLAREDASRLYRQGAEKVRSFEINASNYRGGARSARQGASNALMSGAFNMASTALSGATQYSKMTAK